MQLHTEERRNNNMDHNMAKQLQRHAQRLVVLAPCNPASYDLLSSVLLQQLMIDPSSRVINKAAR